MSTKKNEQSSISSARDNPVALFAKLTAREKELLRLLVGGNTNGQIADCLNISIRTVEFHRSR